MVAPKVVKFRKQFTDRLKRDRWRERGGDMDLNFTAEELAFREEGPSFLSHGDP